MINDESRTRNEEGRSTHRDKERRQKAARRESIKETKGERRENKKGTTRGRRERRKKADRRERRENVAPRREVSGDVGSKCGIWLRESCALPLRGEARGVDMNKFAVGIGHFWNLGSTRYRA